ncbi:MAG: ATP-grasp domain-containing protein [Lachnospiraceae bacterium]|nr:ATP-grasp domain-containing protein [Lachnospiraceae bacterium]
MKRAAIIGASAEAVHSIEVARELDVETIALDGNSMAEGLSAANHGIIVDISNEEETISLLQKEKPDFVLTVPIGRYLTTIGAVNDALGLRGVSKAAAKLCTDKYAFHQALGNLRPCQCYLLNASVIKDKTIQDFTLQYPAILKPRFGSGSRAVTFLTNEQAAEKALQEILSDDEDFVLEEAFPGEEYGVDGAMTGTEFQLILLRKKINTPPPARQAVGYYSEFDQTICTRVKDYLEKVVAVMGLQDCLFHADLMIRDEQVRAIELSARPSGHNLHNLFTPMTTGIDMAEQFIRYQTGMLYHFKPDFQRKMLIHYFNLENCDIEAVPEVEDIKLNGSVRLEAWYCTIKPGDHMEQVINGHSLMGRGYFVLEYTGEEQGTEQVEKILVETAVEVLGYFKTK